MLFYVAISNSENISWILKYKIVEKHLGLTDLNDGRNWDTISDLILLINCLDI